MLMVHAVHAAPLELEVQGKISRTNDASHSVYRLSRSRTAEPARAYDHDLDPWTPNSTFTGPLLSDVLKLVDAHGRPWNCTRSTTTR